MEGTDVDTEATQSEVAAEVTSEPATPATDADVSALDAALAAVAPTAVPAPASSKRPSKFLADLTKAMQAAAEAAREQTLGQFQADAKTFIELVHARSSGDATTLRQQSDTDISAIRDWSKAEIARIREETDARIAQRKTRLESEIEDHAALIELQIERVQARVGAFEAEMAAFFERLLAEDDPSQIAAMANNLPEPPTFDEAEIETLADALAVAAASTPAVEATEPDTSAAGHADTTEMSDVDREQAFASIQAAASAAELAAAEAEAAAADAEAAAADAEAAAARAHAAEPPTEASTQSSDEPVVENDPRLTALEAAPDFAAAESEALADLDAAATADEVVEELSDEDLSARLAALTAAAEEQAPADKPATSTTQVVVVGLVSVASIASFKRHLGRAAGVQSVGVTSGPDGEFLFNVVHADTINLRDVVPGLPGFQARVKSSGEGVINVTAHDPESDG